MPCGIPNTPYKHTFDGGNVHPYNVLGDRGEFPEGHFCLCGEKPWHQMTLEESFNMQRNGTL